MLTDPGGDDAVAVDVGDPGHRDEDRSSAEDLDDDAEDAGRTPTGAEQGDEVANTTDLIAVRVENRHPGDPGSVDASALSAHVWQG